MNKVYRKVLEMISKILDAFFGLLFLVMVTLLAYKYFKDPSKLDILKESINYIRTL
ncbi:hypothetical protein [Thermoanaerobacterium sp. R66]|uniref:hypothetical protein n=1 Tax=Thermoanaerobacterium sp. R66 TaxID=2742479 RepID=UPI00237FE5E3|nr:hypothetical protein [Thermoanaerobacterium sp. R66]MDE4542849.1 hypothetical protein [Thermoanaerobacterium sp. R66]